MDTKNSLSEGIRKLMLAGIGAVAATAEKSQEVLDDLGSRGEITVEQGKALNQELKHNMEESRKKAEEKAAAAKEEKKPDEEKSGKKDFAAYVAGLSPEELTALKEQIAKTEEK